MHGSPVVIEGLILILGGLVMCFRGRALFRVLLPMMGFCVFALTTMAFARPYAEGDLVSLVSVGLVGGALGAALLMAAYLYGLFLVGAAFGGHMGALLAHRYGYDPGTAVLLAGVLGGLAAVAAERLLITLATSLWGAMLAISGFLLITGKLPVDRLLDPSALLTLGQRADHAPLAWLLLALGGVVFQSRPEKKAAVVA